MIVFRLFWAVFLAGLVGYAFHRSWRWEHAPASDEERHGETVVWLSPLILPILLVSICVLFLLMRGPTEGLEEFLRLCADVTVTLSVYFAVLLAVLPVLRRHFSARACATLWLVPVFLFYQPRLVMQNSCMPRFTLYLPGGLLRVFPWLWLAGFAVVLGRDVVVHIRFRRRLLADARPVEEPEILALWQAELEKAGYRKPVRLVCSGRATSPLSMGNTKRGRVTVLPERFFTPEELGFIFSHELRHLQRCDVDTKIFLSFCRALCWFNPLVWLAVRRAVDDLELSCDERVLEGCGAGERRAYAALLLGSACDGRGYTTCLSAAAGSLRYRLKNVVAGESRRIGTGLLAAAMFVCVMSYGAVAVTSDRGTAAELIFSSHAEDWTVESVSFDDGGGGDWRPETWDEEKLMAYLGTVGLEKLVSANELDSFSDPSVSLFLRGPDRSVVLTLDGQLLAVQPLGVSGWGTYYLVRTEVDWAAVQACRLSVG